MAILSQYRPISGPQTEDSLIADQLDKIDFKILRLLQADGRMGNAEIAKRVNTSAATCHRRTQRLFEEGYVSAVRAQIALTRSIEDLW